MSQENINKFAARLKAFGRVYAVSMVKAYAASNAANLAGLCAKQGHILQKSGNLWKCCHCSYTEK